MNMLHNQLSEMLWTIVTRFVCNTETLHDFPCTLKASSLRKEEKSKDKTARSRRQEIIPAIKLKKREKEKK
jgi:hypothetical protein